MMWDRGEVDRVTIMEARVPAPAADHDHMVGDPDNFDPLDEFYGQWNTELADRYHPFLARMFGRWECVGGRLVVAPTEAFGNSYGEGGMIALLRAPARAAGFFVTPPLNLSFSPGDWIEPDVCVLHRVPQTEHTNKWVPADHFTMPVEFVSPKSSKKADEIDKPALCAAAGIPYFMRVEIDHWKRTVAITQYKLVDGDYRQLAQAFTGERFTMTEPFEASFDTTELLAP
jgi:Uma2 family endonuclease